MATQKQSEAPSAPSEAEIAAALVQAAIGMVDDGGITGVAPDSVSRRTSIGDLNLDSLGRIDFADRLGRVLKDTGFIIHPRTLEETAELLLDALANPDWNIATVAKEVRKDIDRRTPLRSSKD